MSGSDRRNRDSNPSVGSPTLGAVYHLRNRFSVQHVEIDAVEANARMRADYDGVVRMFIKSDHTTFYQPIPLGISRREAHALIDDTLGRVAARRRIPTRASTLTESDFAGASSVPMSV